MCFQLTHFPCDDWENIYTLSYYHHRIGSMNYHPLFRVRSWNNGVGCMSFCILIKVLLYLIQVTILLVEIATTRWDSNASISLTVDRLTVLTCTEWASSTGLIGWFRCLPFFLSFSARRRLAAPAESDILREKLILPSSDEICIVDQTGEPVTATGLTATSKFKPRLPAQWAVGTHHKGPSRMEQ